MNELPTEIINLILEYQGFHVLRNGKYMRRISNEDPRRRVLMKIPKHYTTKEFDFGIAVCIRTQVNNKEIYIIIQRIIVTTHLMWLMNINKYELNSTKEYCDKIQYLLK